jgi:hypothetical protein
MNTDELKQSVKFLGIPSSLSSSSAWICVICG